MAQTTPRHLCSTNLHEILLAYMQALKVFSFICSKLDRWLLQPLLRAGNMNTNETQSLGSKAPCTVHSKRGRRLKIKEQYKMDVQTRMHRSLRGQGKGDGGSNQRRLPENRDF